EPVVILLRDRVVLVGVTFGAHHREAQPGGAGGGDPVLYRFGPILFVVAAAFVVDLGVAVKTSGNLLLQGGVGQQVAGQLLDGELIKRHVLVERVDHPFTVRPDRTRQVHLIAIGIGVTRQVQPSARDVFAVML